MYFASYPLKSKKQIAGYHTSRQKRERDRERRERGREIGKKKETKRNEKLKMREKSTIY